MRKQCCRKLLGKTARERGPNIYRGSSHSMENGTKENFISALYEYTLQSIEPQTQTSVVLAHLLYKTKPHYVNPHYARTSCKRYLCEFFCQITKKIARSHFTRTLCIVYILSLCVSIPKINTISISGALRILF